MHEALVVMGDGRMGEIRRAIESGFRIGARSPSVVPETCRQTEMMARLLARPTSTAIPAPAPEPVPTPTVKTNTKTSPAG